MTSVVSLQVVILMIVYPQVSLSLFVTINNDSHQDNNQDNHHPEAQKKMVWIIYP